MIKKVLNAKVYDIVEETPLDHAKGLSERLRNSISLKREDLHAVFSFKIRGAYNCIAHLSKEQKSAGVIAASAGNHAQGVAKSAQILGIKATIVMPQTTPSIKVEAVKSFGAEVVLSGDNYSEAAETCRSIQKKSGMTYIHPFDDELVIAGQGTVADEILRQSSGQIDYIFVPIGGGGLAAGVAAFMKSVRPDVQIIGVEPEDSAAMTESLAAGERVELETVGIFADGVAVKQVGKHTFEYCRQYLDDTVLVNTDELCSAIKLIYQDTRSIVEPAGALAVAGMQKFIEINNLENKHIVAVNSGANMNFDRLSFVAERTRIGEHLEALYAVRIPEKPGALRRFCTELVGDRNITEFNYRKTSDKQAEIFVGIGIKSTEEKESFQATMNQSDYKCTDLTDNELAKTHVRYMVGSRSEPVHNEYLYHFWFPERPGALVHFLDALKVNWNISLFHYRSQGGDFGRVLIALEHNPSELDDVKNRLLELGYPYTEESENPAYKLFLSGH